MPQKDILHDIVRLALERAGWRIVAEQFMLEEDNLRAFIDLTAEPTEVVVVPLNNGSIAVEVKSFSGTSFVTELHEALGQYLLYLDKLEALGHTHILFLAIPSRTYHAYFLRPSVQRLIKRYQVRLLVVNPIQAEIELWTN